jgi:hypothetical protein
MILRNTRGAVNQSLLFVVIFLSASATAVHPISQNAGQTNPGPFATIPEAYRPQLFERLQKFVKFQGNQQWDKVYDLSIESVQRPYPSRDEFVKRNQEVVLDPRLSKLIEFSPQSAHLVNVNGEDKEWSIEGCAKYTDYGRPVYFESGTDATLHNGAWYFSYLAATRRAVDGPKTPCKIHEGQNQK